MRGLGGVMPVSVLCLAPLGGADVEGGGAVMDGGAMVEVTAPLPLEPLVTVLDPSAPRQPVPAPDGAEFLKGVPGFSVTRKGGVGGDALLRGMGGSRLGLLVEGEQLLGGCGRRMDPPTAYVVPGTYDRVTVVKGPQTVRFGPGNTAGTVRFERDLVRLGEPGVEGVLSALGGSFGRGDLGLDLRGGTPDFQGRFLGARSRARDYRDGLGNPVHAHYGRWSEAGSLAWTPTGDTTLEVRGGRSDGKAAYADRAMDGSRFLRENLGFRGSFRRLSGVVEGLDVQGYRARVDHVMDDASERPFSPTPEYPEPSAMNPDRTTRGGRAALELRLAPGTRLRAGLDTQANEHRSRMSPAQRTLPVENRPRVPTARFRQVGIFGELDQAFAGGTRVVAGARVDRWHGEDARARVAGAPNPTAGHRRDETLPGGFLRWERETAPGSTLYAGLGHARRFPDFWEAIAREGQDSASAFHVRAERTTQVDAGWVGHAGAARVSLSAFWGRVGDFILIQYRVPRPGDPGVGRATASRNVEAGTWGGEAAVETPLGEAFRLDASLAYVRGENRTDRRPLPQIPPLEARVGIVHEAETWSLGLLVRGVARQDRFSLDQGTIVGPDLGPTAGFFTLGLHGGWRPAPGWRITAGVDNLLDRAYAEHVNRGAVDVSGYGPAPLRVPEPGRTLWVKAALAWGK